MNNNTQVRVRARGSGSYVASILLAIMGGMLTLGFGLAFSDGGWDSAEYVILLLFFIGGLYLLYRGIKGCRMYRFSRRVLSAMGGLQRARLALLAQISRKDYTALVRDLRELAARRYFPGAYVDLNRKEFVLVPGGPQPPLARSETMLREKRKAAVAPIYLFGATWLCWALIFPLYRPLQLALAGAASVAVFLIARRVFPERIVIVEAPREDTPEPKPQPKPEEKINTGDKELDEVLNAAMGYMRELTALDVAITNEKIDKPVQDLVRISTRIFEHVRKNPTQIRRIRQFMNYYLPTAIGLLKNYDELSREPVKGANIQQAMSKIEGAVEVIRAAFEKELDGLYQDKAMDISVDIEVLNTMLEQEGLTGEPLQPEKASEI